MAFPPGFAAIAALIADPAREAMLVALADGRALPAGELAAAAGISAQSASRHLQKLVAGGVLSVWSQGRFRYYRITSTRVTAAIESLCVLAGAVPARRGRKPPADLCFARRCYDHLAGALGVTLASMLLAKGYIALGPGGQDARFTKTGAAWLAENELCRGVAHADLHLCMDWTERRPHLSGPAARALLRDLMDKKFLRAASNNEEHGGETRALTLTPEGRRWFIRNGASGLEDPRLRRAV